MAGTQNHSGILFQSDNLIPVTASNQYLDTGIFKVFFFLTPKAFLPVPQVSVATSTGPSADGTFEKNKTNDTSLRDVRFSLLTF